MLVLHSGPNFSGRTEALYNAAKLVGWPRACYIDPAAESSLTGLSINLRHELEVLAGGCENASHSRLIDVFDLDGLLDRTLHSLSGGELVRSALVSSLLQGAKLVQLDCALEQLDHSWRLRTIAYVESLALDECYRWDIVDNRSTDLSLGPNWHNVNYTVNSKDLSQVEMELLTPPSGEQSPVSIDGLEFCYRGASGSILKDVNLCLEPATTYFIRGKNGAGKSTFLRLMCGVILPQRGSIHFAGKRFNPQLRERFVCVAFQNPDVQFETLSVLSEVISVCRSRPGVSWPTPERLLQFGGIPEFSHRVQISESTFVVKKRLANLCTMLSGLQVLAFDEPTLGQDDVYVASFVAKIRKLESIGHTILMISHDPRLSRFFFDARELIVEQNDIRMIEQ